MVEVTKLIQNVMRSIDDINDYEESHKLDEVSYKKINDMKFEIFSIFVEIHQMMQCGYFNFLPEEELENELDFLEEKLKQKINKTENLKMIFANIQLESEETKR